MASDSSISVGQRSHPMDPPAKRQRISGTPCVDVEETDSEDEWDSWDEAACQEKEKVFQEGWESWDEAACQEEERNKNSSSYVPKDNSLLHQEEEHNKNSSSNGRNEHTVNEEVLVHTVNEERSQAVREFVYMSKKWQQIVSRCHRQPPNVEQVNLAPPQLNQRQSFAASSHVSQPLMLIAGAGCGKTMTLLGRIRHLIQVVGVRPEHLLVVTFTNQTVDEIVERLHTCLGHEVTTKLVVTTLHSFCFALVRCFGDKLHFKGKITILSSQARSNIVKDAWRWSLLEQERVHCTKWLDLEKDASWMSVFRAMYGKEPVKYKECFVGSDCTSSQTRSRREGEVTEVKVTLSAKILDLFGTPQASSKGSLRIGSFSQDEYFFFDERAHGKSLDHIDEGDVVVSGQSKYWAAAKKFKLGEVAISKGSVLFFAEIRSPNERRILSVEDAGNLVVQVREILLDTACLLRELKVKFVVPKSPLKGSPAALRAAGNPQWRSEMAKKVFQSLVDTHMPEINERVNAGDYFTSERPGRGVIPQLSHLIEHAKRQGHTAKTYEPPQDSSPKRGDFYFIFQKYEEKLRTNNLVDFHDLLVYAADLLQKHEDIRRIVTEAQRYVLVDEFQDMNEAQLRVLICLQRESGCVTVVGDDDQQIYAFNGSCARIFERFREAFAGHVSGGVEQVTLEENYRSSEKILAVGNSVLLDNKGRVGKVLQPSAPWARDQNVCPPPGLWECGTPEMEAKAIADEIGRLVDEKGGGAKQYSYCDIAVLYRCFQSAKFGKAYGPLEVELGAKGIPFAVIREGSLWEKACATDLLAYLRLIVNSSDDVSFIRVLNRPPRGCGKALTLRIEEQQAIGEDEGQRLSCFAAAKELLRASAEDEESPLSRKSAQGLQSFVNLVETLQRDVAFMAIDEVLKAIVTRTDYVEFFQSQKKKTGKRKAQADSDDENDDSDDEKAGAGSDPDSEDEAGDEDVHDQRLPGALRTIVEVAKHFAESWEWARPWAIDDSNPSKVASLQELCCQRLKWNPSSTEEMQQALPAKLLDEVVAETRKKGRLQIDDFLAHVALGQASTSKKGPANKSAVCISTVHAAKGCEWPCVFVPHFNEGFFPVSAHSVKELDVDGRVQKRVPTAEEEEAHLEEERRLAHVAMTRAKHRLVLSYLRYAYSKKHQPEMMSTLKLPEPILPYGEPNAAMSFWQQPLSKIEKRWKRQEAEQQARDQHLYLGV